MLLALLIAAQTWGPQRLPPVLDAEDPLVDAAGIVKDLIVELAYATSDNITGRALYQTDEKCLLRRSGAEGRDARGRVSREPEGVVALQPALRLALAGCALPLSAGATFGVLELVDQRPARGRDRKQLIELGRTLDHFDSGLARGRPDDAAAQRRGRQVSIGGDQRGRNVVAAEAGLESGGDAQAPIAQVERAAQPRLCAAWPHLGEQRAGEAAVAPPGPVRIGLPARGRTRRRQVEPDSVADALSHAPVPKGMAGGLRDGHLD